MFATKGPPLEVYSKMIDRSIGKLIQFILAGVVAINVRPRDLYQIPNDLAELAGQLLGIGCAGPQPIEETGTPEGERTRALLARALIADASLLVLDEPGTGLDLPGRELLIGALTAVANEHPQLATVVATQHVEELAPIVSHVLLLRAGTVVAAGPVAETLTDDRVSDCFGLPIRIERSGGRYYARA